MTIQDVARFIGTEGAKTVIALATTSLVGVIAVLATLRHKSSVLRQLLSDPNRNFILHFRGNENPEKTKVLRFRSDGKIENQPDHNEHTWKISFALLRIYNRKGEIYSRFKWDAKQGQLVSTNAANLPCFKGQYIVPSFVPYTEDKEE